VLKAKAEEFTDEELKAVCVLPNFEKLGALKHEDDPYRHRPQVTFKFATIEDR
jgi:hypothetical protein